MSGASISYPHHHRQQRGATGGFSTADTNQVQSRTESRSANIIAMATSCYPPTYELSSPPAPQPQQQQQPQQPQPSQQQQQRTVQVPVQQKDYSRPLHVDCSVEYELPYTAKPPQGVRNEPLLMIHPSYFRKIESQRRSPFINNLPAAARPQQQAAVKRRTAATAATHHLQHQVHQVQVRQPQQAAQYPVQYAAAAMDRHHPQHLWEQMPPLVPISQSYCGGKRDHLVSACGTYSGSSGSDSGHWTDPDRSPDRPDDHKHILSGKYRQYLRAHRLHPYVTSAIPLASTFPQIQQVCYNV